MKNDTVLIFKIFFKKELNNMSERLKNKVVIITGAASGMGKQLLNCLPVKEQK